MSSAGPFTLFAQTDDAFAKIPVENLQAVLKDKEKLTAILTYHVVSGKVMASDVMGLNSAKAVQGGEVKFDTANGVVINNAEVAKTDTKCTNGVNHVIDTVLMPS